MRLKINEHHYFVDKKAIEEALEGVEPGIKGKYFIEVNGIKYPAKQALSRCVGVPSIRIQSGHALAILSKIGFEIFDEGGSVR